MTHSGKYSWAVAACVKLAGATGSPRNRIGGDAGRLDAGDDLVGLLLQPAGVEGVGHLLGEVDALVLQVAPRTARPAWPTPR